MNRDDACKGSASRFAIETALRAPPALGLATSVPEPHSTRSRARRGRRARSLSLAAQIRKSPPSIPGTHASTCQHLSALALVFRPVRYVHVHFMSLSLIVQFSQLCAGYVTFKSLEVLVQQGCQQKYQHRQGLCAVQCPATTVGTHRVLTSKGCCPLTPNNKTQAKPVSALRTHGVLVCAYL